MSRSHQICLILLMSISTTFIALDKNCAPCSISRQSLAVRINLNHAPVHELLLLPKIGLRKAYAICRLRKQYGPFTSYQQLSKISGIGPAIIRRIKPFCCLTEQR